MTPINHLSEIKNGNFYVIYNNKKLDIIECYDEGDKEIVGDIPTGVLRCEMRMIKNYASQGVFSRAVDIVDHEANQGMFMPIYPEPQELVFEMNDDEVATHIYMEAF